MAGDDTPASAAGIIVVLGHESGSPSGRKTDEAHLSVFALARCKKAADLAAAFPDYLILPTGGFGQFNPTDRAHGELLREQLVVFGVQESRILTYTNSSNTVEDALAARRRVFDLSVGKLIVVTSDFHMRRAAYIFRRVFPDKQLCFVESERSTENTTLEKSECRKLRRLKSEWVDVPLYGFSGDARTFPTEVYKNAEANLNHYDTISVALISGMFIVFGYPYAIKFSSNLLAGIATLFSAYGILLLLSMYQQLAWFARIARRVMHNIETQYDPGFSLGYSRQDRSAKPSLAITFTRRGFSITHTVTMLALTMVLIQVILGLFLMGWITRV